MGNTHIVIGLGNPGEKYRETRHNVGFMVIDFLSAKYGVRVEKLKHKALIGEGTIGGNKVVLAKPQTYMNSSGESVREIVDWYKTPLSNVIIVYDDIDLEPGRIRIRPKGSSGTHNGMKSVIYHLESDEFPRVRIGIGKPPMGCDLVYYVLSSFMEEEAQLIKKSIERAVEAIAAIVESGIDEAMNKFNRQVPEDELSD